MKQSLKSAILAVAILCCAAGVAAQSTPAASSPDYSLYSEDFRNLLPKGQLVVALVKADQYPFFYVTEQGELDGLDVRLAQKIADELKLTLVFDRSAESFNDVVTNVATGKADIAISKLSRTLARARQVIFTQPYLVFRHALCVNRLRMVKFCNEAGLPNLLRSLRDPGVKLPEAFKIGVIQKSSYVGFAKTYFPAATVVEYPDWDAVVKAVFDGEVTAAYRDELEVLKVTKSRSDAGLHVKAIVLSDLQDPIAMAVSAKAPVLARWLDIFMEREGLSYTADSLLAEFSQIKPAQNKGAK